MNRKRLNNNKFEQENLKMDLSEKVQFWKGKI